jgi:hypothetical protein
MINRLICIVLIVILMPSCRKTTNLSLFIEAESFNDIGGWVADPQFALRMGSPYLLAHGLGKPVQNAKTTVEFPGKGNYNIWVRTKNWAPGNWEAPGRFRLIIDGNETGKDLGTEEGWHWQNPGKVRIKRSSTIIELKDLTGFEGRCDALYFTTGTDSPPDDLPALEKWRNRMLYPENTESETLGFDLVVVGGGLAGCGASIAAAEQGLKVALIQDRPVLGGNASGEVRVNSLGITWKYDRILGMIRSGEWVNGSPDAVADDARRLDNIKKYNNISLFLDWKAFNAETADDSIVSVDARNNITARVIRFRAPLYADCTGDGWIGFWAGADYMYGREDSSEFNELYSTLKRKMHSDFFSTGIFKEADVSKLLIPDKKDMRVMGSSVLWRTRNAPQPVSFPQLPWAETVARNYSEINGEWFWEYSHDTINQIDDGEFIRDHLLKAIYGSFSNAKKDSANKYRELEWVSFLLGKRESRRLAGDYIFTVNDARKHTEFEDAVAMEKRDVDVHYQQNLVDPSKPDFLSDALYYNAEEYFIPYRSLYSRNIKNLFMAGRCFSCSHLGLGGPRVMNTTGQMGCAVGYASAVCRKHNVIPKMVYRNYLNELKALIDSSNTSRPF